MQEQIAEFIEAMAAEGVDLAEPSEIIADDTVRRAHMVGDKKGKTTISYKLGIADDGFAFGWCNAHKLGGDLIKWHSKPKRGQTKAVKARSKEWHEEAKAERERVAAEAMGQAVADTVEMLGRAGSAEEHPYLDRKGVSWPELKQCDGLLMVPVYDQDGMRGCQLIAADGKRWFVTGSRKAGAWHLIAADGDAYDRVFIAEGLSTGLTIRGISGCPVYVAIDAGNMKRVSEAVRNMHPGAQIIIAGDNDLWTRDAKGQPMNTGRNAAEQAALACGGHMWLPEGLEHPHTDWNDAFAVMGEDWVRVELAKLPEIQPHFEPEMHEYEMPDFGGEPYSEESGQGTFNPIAYADKIKSELRPQGYIGKKYYFFPRSTGDIEEMTTADLRSEFNLYHLARKSFWESMMQDLKNPTGKDAVTRFTPLLMEYCKDKGKFDPDRVMSSGVWPDGKSGVVANMGDRLYIPGKGFMDHADYESDKVYISAPKSVMIDLPALRNSESVKVREICESLSWKHNISGSLLAGWIYAAILSGVLRWRPHIFITGQKGSGKTTVMRDIVKAILKGWSTNADGGTTEAGFRRKLGNKAQPVVSDEVETETEKQRKNADDVLFLARQSSSGAEYSNAYVDITVHSCFCFGGISPNIKKGADKDRITVMELVADRGDGFRSRWKDKEKFIKDTLTPEFCRALIKRAIDNAEVYLQNVEIFEDELSEMLGNSRSAEQFAPMIAGLYALHSTNTIDPKRAREWVREQDWEFFREEDEGSDAENMVSHLLTAMAEFTVGDRTNKISVSEMLCMVRDNGVQAPAAANSLGRYGLKLDGDWLVVANSKSRIGELMKDTPWSVPKSTLSRYPGATPVGTTRFASGVVSRGIKVPLAGLIDGFEAVDDAGDESPF